MKEGPLLYNPEVGYVYGYHALCKNKFKPESGHAT